MEGLNLQLVTGLDDHSRYCVMAKLLPRATAKPICDALLEALNRFGVPDEILTDNAKVFTGRLHKMPTNVLFDRICLNNGIKHILTAPYSRQRPARSRGCTRRFARAFWPARVWPPSRRHKRLWMSGSMSTTMKEIISPSATSHPSAASNSPPRAITL